MLCAAVPCFYPDLPVGLGSSLSYKLTYNVAKDRQTRMSVVTSCSSRRKNGKAGPGDTSNMGCRLAATYQLQENLKKASHEVYG